MTVRTSVANVLKKRSHCEGEALKTATLHDVAREAGVSVSTVSRALNDQPFVRPEVRDRVLLASEALGYRPDVAARSMRTGTTGAVGFVVSDISNPLLASIAKAADLALSPRGYALMIANSANDPEHEAELISAFRQRRLDGLIIATADERAPGLGDRVAAFQASVLLDREVPGSGADAVLSDHGAGLGEAIRHLAGLGHRRIALIAGTPAQRGSRVRIETYEAELERLRIPHDAQLCRPGEMTAEDGYRAVGEILALAHTTADAGGRYISHVRSEDRHFWEAIEELLTIGREAKLPVQISHVTLAMQSLWGQADRLVRRLDQARAEGIEVTADIYPYPYWHSTLTVLFPERDYKDRTEAEFAVTQVSTPAGLKLGVYRPNPEFTGRTVAEVAQALGVDSVSALIELVDRAERMRAEGGTDVESVIGTSMIEPDITTLIRWPHTNFCTDGSLAGRHPRGFGSYPRFLGRYVREQGVLSLAEAVHRASALAADQVGLRDRGRIAPGQAADLVLFDPAAVIDRATPDDPHALSEGIVMTWVNGEVVYREGRTTGARPGQVLRRSVGR